MCDDAVAAAATADGEIDNENGIFFSDQCQINPIQTEKISHAHDQRQIMGYYKSNNISTPLFDIIRPHICNVCKRSFKYLGTLEQHVKIHESPMNTDTG